MSFYIFQKDFKKKFKKLFLLENIYQNNHRSAGSPLGDIIPLHLSYRNILLASAMILIHVLVSLKVLKAMIEILSVIEILCII